MKRRAIIQALLAYIGVTGAAYAQDELAKVIPTPPSDKDKKNYQDCLARNSELPVGATLVYSCSEPAAGPPYTFEINLKTIKAIRIVRRPGDSVEISSEEIWDALTRKWESGPL